MKCARNQSGYTLIELLVVMAIVGILLGFVTINLLHIQQNTSLTTSKEQLIADIKSQQMKAMNGTDTGGGFGIHFSSNSTYTLFQGMNYSSSSPTNFLVSVNESVSFSGNNIVFDGVTGEIDGYTTPVSITVRNTAGGEQATIQLNKYGVITQE